MSSTIGSLPEKFSKRLLIASTLVAFSCKQVNDGASRSGDTADQRSSSDEAADGDGSQVVDAARRQTPGFYAQDSAYIQKSANFFFKIFNEGFTRNFNELPLSGEVPDDKKPHSGGYYAEQDGGTDQIVAGTRTPLEKYDAAFNGGESKASGWERQKHSGGPAWAGHCNGFSAAAQRHPKEPAKNVVRNGVTFSPQDIKALLAEIHMSADYEFLGGNRCDETGAATQPGARQDPAVMGACEDVNPGTFHVAIANWLGRMKHTLVMDDFAGDQVWNYPLYKYTVTKKDPITASQARQSIVGSNGAYEFNPTAVKFVLVHTQLTFAQASRREMLGQRNPGTMELDYVLELNAQGEVVGGEWAGAASQKNHPDFIWVALEPQEPNGTRYMGNAFLSNQEVIKMWAESAGEDPENPPLDIKRPSGPDDWGKWADFEVVLDGNARGAVFAGKPTMLKVKRKERLAAQDSDLEVLLNGSSIKTLKATGAADLELSFSPGVGLNKLEFIWKKGATVLDDQFVRFHVLR